MNIRRAAVSAATMRRFAQLARARKSACSATTMASSTTIPSIRISAKSEIMLKVSPAAYMIAMAAIIDTGMPAATQSAVRAFRNRNSSPTTSARPIAPFVEQDVEPPGDLLGPRADQVHRHAGGQAALHLGRDLLHGGLDADRVALARTGPPGRRWPDCRPRNRRAPGPRPRPARRPRRPRSATMPSGFVRSTIVRDLVGRPPLHPGARRAPRPSPRPPGSSPPPPRWRPRSRASSRRGGSAGRTAPRSPSRARRCPGSSSA